MKKLITLAFALAVVATVFATAFVVFGSSDAEAKQADPNIVVVLRGLGLPVDPPIAMNPPLVSCFETGLYDAKTDRLIGNGVDCLNILEVITHEEGDGDPVFGFLIDRTTFLNLPQGTVVANGLTTVQPTAGGSPDFTHIVGDIPVEGADSFVEGLSTGRFEGATGRIRLSGAVNLSEFPDEIGFNCIFVIDID